MRSVERGICPIGHVHNEQTVPIIMAGCIAHAWNGRMSTSVSKIWRHHRVPRPRFPKWRENFGDSRTFKADIGLLNICMDFQDHLA